jgi:hypothetical protein
MKFEDVVGDIRGLVGVKLQSIRKGADITITELKLVEGRIILIDSGGGVRSRNLSELRRIWEALMLEKAVHVDTVLGGSGSSRNQPETIMANLPYVEWLLVDGKKHLSFVKEYSRAPGTLKKMDVLAAAALCDSMSASRQVFPAALFVVENPRLITGFLESVCGTPAEVVSAGLYKHVDRDRVFWIAKRDLIPSAIGVGLYPVARAKGIPSGTSSLLLGGIEFFLVQRDGLFFALCKQ